MAHLSEAILVLDPDLRITQYLAQAERVYGWRPDEIVGHHVGEFRWTFPEDDGAAFDAKLRLGEEARVVMRCQRKDGTWIHLDVVVTPLRNEARALVGWLSVARDVTSRFEVEAQLRAAHGQLAELVVGSGDGYWTWDIPSGHSEFSERWAEMLGVDHASLHPDISTWVSHVHPDDLAAASAALQAHIEGRAAVYQAEYRMRHADGRWLWVLDRGKIVERDPSGVPVRMAGGHTDITERKAMEQALREREAELSAALDRVKTLSALLPLCMHCRRVRDDAGYWAQIEEYLSAHTDTSFSHGICPECLKAHYPDYPQHGDGH